MKKQLIFFASVIALILVLSACGSSTNKSAANTTTPATVVSPATVVTPATASGDVQDVQLIASAKTFKYDKEEYIVKKDQPVKLTLVEKDGVHGAELKDFNINLDATHLTSTFTPTKAGTYVIKCSVPCGAGHMTMTTKLTVQ